MNGVHEPAEPYKLQIGKGDYINLYSDFLLNAGIANEDRDFGISPLDFIGGSFLLVFDRSKEKCNRFHRHPTEGGVVDINIRTKTNLTNTVTVLVYATYSSEVIIDDAGNVLMTKTF